MRTNCRWGRKGPTHAPNEPKDRATVQSDQPRIAVACRYMTSDQHKTKQWDRLTQAAMSHRGHSTGTVCIPQDQPAGCCTMHTHLAMAAAAHTHVQHHLLQITLPQGVNNHWTTSPSRQLLLSACSCRVLPPAKPKPCLTHSTKSQRPMSATKALLPYTYKIVC
jgi:hypothetical protein